MATIPKDQVPFWGKGIVSMLTEELLRNAEPLTVFRRFGGPEYPKLNRWQKARRFLYKVFGHADPYYPVAKLPEPSGGTIKFRRLKPFGSGPVYPHDPGDHFPGWRYKEVGPAKFLVKDSPPEELSELVRQAYDEALDWTMPDLTTPTQDYGMGEKEES